MDPWSARSVPGLLDGAGHAILGTVWSGNSWNRRYRRADARISERTVGLLSGSCLLVRRAAFDSIGGFDSRYSMYMEDVDFGDRLGKAGWHNVFVPSAEVTHARGHAAGRHPETMLPRITRVRTVSRPTGIRTGGRLRCGSR